MEAAGKTIELKQFFAACVRFSTQRKKTAEQVLIQGFQRWGGALKKYLDLGRQNIIFNHSLNSGAYYVH